MMNEGTIMILSHVQTTVFCTHLLAHATEELIQLEILPGVLQQQAELQFFNVVLGKDI